MGRCNNRELLTDEISQDFGSTSHCYNQHGELTQSTDARGIVNLRTVDAQDRVSSVDFGEDLGLATTYTYQWAARTRGVRG